MRRRIPALALFLIALAWSYQSSIEPVKPMRTEDGQQVVFDRITWQLRELSKKVPPQEAWPSGPALQEAFARYGLDRNTPPKAIPMPARITGDVYLVGQDRVSNLTYILDCGSAGVAIID